MKVLFIVYHPVDPYIVFETAKKIEENKGESFFIIIEKENIIKRIVDSKGFKNKVIGHSKKTVVGKILDIVTIVFKISRIVKKYKPDIVFSTASPYTSFALKFDQTPLICWDDTETSTFNLKHSFRRMNSLLLTDSYYKEMKHEKVIKFNGYKELAYLHPNIFSPEKDVLKSLGLVETDVIVLMRFSALHAMHDIGLESEVIANDHKILNFIKKIEKKYKAKIFISVTERDLDERFKDYKLRIEPSKYVHLLAFCSLYIGEGTTTACEAGVLGVPWIALRDQPLGYLIDQEYNYSLGLRINNLDDALNKGEGFLMNMNGKKEWKVKSEKLISEKIDVSAFLTWFIEAYPESHKIMRENPNYQNRFK